jgi:uncharacterized CHY-type Zn-finger protein
MKTNSIYFSITAIIILLVFYSCNKEYQKYSCDETINKWVIQNKSTLDTIGREYIITLPIDYQIAAFNYLSHSHKVDLWNSKIDLVLNQPYYNEQNRILIRQIQEFITEDLYNGMIDVPEDLIWCLMYESGIDSANIFIDFATLFTYEEFEYYVANYEEIMYEWFGENYEIRAAPPKCMCNWNVTCSMMGHGTCEEGYQNCAATSWGCGYLWSSPCEGRCDNNPFQIYD